MIDLKLTVERVGTRIEPVTAAGRLWCRRYLVGEAVARTGESYRIPASLVRCFLAGATAYGLNCAKE